MNTNKPSGCGGHPPSNHQEDVGGRCTREKPRTYRGDGEYDRGERHDEQHREDHDEVDDHPLVFAHGTSVALPSR